MRMYYIKARLEAGAIQLSTESHIKQTNGPLKKEKKKSKPPLFPIPEHLINVH